jgi:3-methyladenine DNA glycosylase AlkC
MDVDMEKILSRKGAVRPADVPEEVIELLNRGEIETMNLSESLAVDNTALFEKINSDYSLQIDTEKFRKEHSESKITVFYKAAGAALAELPEDVLNELGSHRSDIVRCWCSVAAGLGNEDIEAKLYRIRSFADDSHMGVREFAWMSLRDDVEKDPERAVSLLESWTADESPYIRRYASELTRPRGVWCRHIDLLKNRPEIGLPVLDPLKNDSEKYVQDSVANWLNDASKTKPDFVISLTGRWLKESSSKATARICKRARRTIDK